VYTSIFGRAGVGWVVGFAVAVGMMMTVFAVLAVGVMVAEVLLFMETVALQPVMSNAAIQLKTRNIRILFCFIMRILLKFVITKL
jgi:hypothetical protein